MRHLWERITTQNQVYPGLFPFFKFVYVCLQLQVYEIP